MFGPLALILVAVAGFSVLVVRRRRARAGEPGGIDLDQLGGFVLVGAAALVLLSVAVVVLGLLRPDRGTAESVAVLGLLVYGVYLTAAGVITLATHRRP